MRTFDLSPLFRSTIGFDHLPRVMDTAFQLSESAQAYPPYNIEKIDADRYRIVMAVAGFAADAIDITTHDGVLTIRGRAASEADKTTYLHRGIAQRAFERKFQLADYVQVKTAQLTDGLLAVDLVREVPEALKPRRIAIQPEGQHSAATEVKAAA